MLLVWYSKGWEDYLQWQQEDKKVVRRINALIADALRHPTEGIGKPECLKHQLSGAWGLEPQNHTRTPLGLSF